MAALTITGVAFVDQLTGQDVDWTLGNVGDQITVIIDFNVSTYGLASTDNKITLNVTDGVLGDGWCIGTNNPFAGMEIGDTVHVTNYITGFDFGNFTIVDKVSDNQIQLDSDIGFVGDDFPSEQAAFSLVRAVTACELMWNFIENSEAVNYISKVDGSTHLLKNDLIDASDAAAYPMTFIGPLPYQIGSATIEGEGIDTTPVYKNSFRIRHNTWITPFMLATQRDDLMAGTKPSYFDLLKCLKYVFKIRALYDATNPNDYEEKVISGELGNTGRFNENFNTDATNYAIDQVVYKDQSSTVIEALELTTNDQTIEITITNTTDTPFSNGNTGFVLNFAKVCFDVSEHSGNSRDMRTNFCFDFAKQTVGVAAVNGNEFGTVRQVFKNIVGTFVNSSTIIVSATVDFHADVVDILSESEIPSFMVWVSVADHTKAFTVSDKVSLLESNEFFINTTDPDMIVPVSKFLRHFETDPDTEGTNAIETIKEDDVTAYTRFYIDRNGRESNEIEIKNISVKVIAKKDVSNQFVLEQFNINIPTTVLLDSTDHQAISIDQNRSFHVPVAEIRKKISIQRRQDLDSGDFYYYDVYYPFLMRWEYWKALAGVDSEFFDSSEPNNGQNHDWHHYAQLAGWELYYEIEIKATKDGVLQEYTDELLIISHDYDSNPDWTVEIKSYDPDTLTQLYDAGPDIHYLLGYKNTLIVAEHELQTGTPVLADHAVRMWIEVYEEGGIDGSRRFSSEWSQPSDTWFVSVVAIPDDKIELTLVGDAIVAKALVDYTQLPNKPRFKVMSRIYDKVMNVCGIGGRQLEDGTCRKLEDGTQRFLE